MKILTIAAAAGLLAATAGLATGAEAQRWHHGWHHGYHHWHGGWRHRHHWRYRHCRWHHRCW
jgi:Spy/CpxP family protein refolding chaperone